MAETLLRRAEAIRRLARRGASQSLSRILEKTRPEDVAAALISLAPAEQRMVFKLLNDDEKAAHVLALLPEADLRNLVRVMDLDRLVEILDLMEVDDETDVIGRLPEDVREKVLARIEGVDREQVEELLTYPDDSAGGIMSPIAFRLHEDATCREAIEALQNAEDVESVFYLYVENDAGQLVGVTSLRNLLTHPPSTRVGDFMSTDVIAVTPETDQEEVARVVSRYDLLAVPVVDEHRRLLGIVTVDDVIDVIKEEGFEDMLLMAGVQESHVGEAASVTGAVRQRVFWLLATLFGGIVASNLVNHWDDTVARWPVIAGFLPAVLGMGGNVGSQSAALTLRNLALGRVQSRDFLRIIWRESRVGLLLGVLYGLLLGGYVYFREPGHPALALGVGLAILADLAVASSVGTIVPMTLDRMGVDPAVATNPFVSTLMDNVGVTIYFVILSFVLFL